MAMDPFSLLILTISVSSFFTFQWLFHKVSPWFSRRVSPGFLSLSDKQKVEWNSRTVSTLHALLVGVFCLYILFFDDAVNEDPVWGDPTLVKTNVAITTGYLISDLLLIFYYWKAIGDKFFVVHHLAALYAYYYVLIPLPSPSMDLPVPRRTSMLLLLGGKGDTFVCCKYVNDQLFFQCRW
uniref:Transmembrane protein 56-B-like n=1 Tax=Gouania willdenowi TaxID=441366 RepID=A0A8C5GZL7_GOUWI